MSNAESTALTDEQIAEINKQTEALAAGIADGSIELPPEMMGMGEPVEAEPAPEVEWFKCKYNHLQRGEFFLMAKNPFTGEVDWQSGPMCARCMAQWQGQKFKTFRCAPPKTEA
jgi:hypothetical protein